MLILDGRKVSEARKILLKERVVQFTSREGRKPHLAVVLVGNDTGSQVYVRNKIKACESVGMMSSQFKLESNTSQIELNRQIEKLNQDDSVDGILVQLPLPKGLSESEVNNLLSPLKDADGLTPFNMGQLWIGEKGVAPCTPTGVMSLLEHYKIQIEGLKAVVVGRSAIVGKPMAHLLSTANATVTICHSKTQNLKSYTQTADLIVLAAGKRHLFGKDDFKKGAIVVDVGIHGSGLGTGVTGDVRFHELEGWVAAATPVPGGVGPMTIVTLLENTMTLAEFKMKKK